MNLQRLISLYRQVKRQGIIRAVQHDYKHQYAVVGVGSHSLATYYPLLSFLGVPIKYIVTQKSNLAEKACGFFPRSQATHDFQKVLKDEAIRGIIICTTPSSQFELTQQALTAGKHVLVEKPVCYGIDQLNQLISIAQTHCLVGLQKRYGRLNSILQKAYKHTASYTANYAVGAYPEGDAFHEIFIHGVDNVNFLFGPGKVLAAQKVMHRGGMIVHTQIQHQNGTVGTLELSTAHDWRIPIDTLRLELDREQVNIQYPNYAESTMMEPTFFGLPIGKAFQHPVHKKVIYQNNNQQATIDSNSLAETGFLPAVQAFIDRTEQPDKFSPAASDIRNLAPTYQLLHELKALTS